MAQVSVVNNGRLGVGTNFVPNDFKMLVDGEEHCAGAFMVNHQDPWSWAEVSLVNRSQIKSWIVDFQGVHEFFVESDGSVFSKGVYLSSDRRLKENISPITDGVAGISLLKPVSFNFKAVEHDTLRCRKFHYGFIAQEIREHFPDMVALTYRDKNKTDSLLSVNYTMVIPLLVKAVQEQQDLIADLYDQIELLISNVPGMTTDSSAIVDFNVGSNDIVLDVQPNPSSGVFYVKATAIGNEHLDLLVTDLSGRLVSGYNVDMTNNNKYKLDCSVLPNGVYLLTGVLSGEVVSTKRIVIK